MKKLKAIGVKSVFIFSLILGAFLGVLVGLGYMLSDFMKQDFKLGLITFVMAPIVYGIIFSIANSALAWVYNRAAESLGGIEITFED